MKPHELRLQNLRKIIDARFDGKAGRLADAIGKKRPQIYRLFGDSDNSRDMGEELAREIELKLQLPIGSLDQDDMTVGDSAQVMAGYQQGGDDKKAVMKDIADLPEEAAAALRPILEALKSKYGGS